MVFENRKLVLAVGAMASFAVLMATTAEAVQLDTGQEDPAVFAAILVQFVKSVETSYVRKVSREDLLVAAMTGLYQAVNKPVPERLRDEIAGATEDELRAVIRRRKSDIGSDASIRGRSAFVVCTNAMQRVLDPYCCFASVRDFGAVSENAQFNSGVAFSQIPIPEPDAVQFQQVPVQPRRPRNMRTPDTPRFPDQLIVKTVIPGSPAQKAGLRPGDRVIAIDATPCEHVTFAHFREVFFAQTQDFDNRQNSHNVKFMRRSQADAVTVPIQTTRYWPENVYGMRRLRDGTWDWFLDHEQSLGYIRISMVDDRTVADFHAAIDTMRQRNVKGLILDLRWCTGGFLTMLADVAHGLVERNQPVANTVRRDGSVEPIDSRAQRIPLTDPSVVVLIGADTMGGGEMIAAALQDHGRSVTVGDRTTGKGSAQQTLKDNPLQQYYLDVDFKLSTSMLQRPSKKNLQRYPHSQPTDDWGVQPDPGRWVPVSRELNQQLKEWWMFHALRPAGDRSELPVDDPENDPQLAAGIRILKELVK